jgi:tRNA-Thr(GGU) m(6)t(6)A37 methyltransferase TsaA
MDGMSSLQPVLRPVGWVRSSLTELADAPRQGDEGAPDAWVEFEDWVVDALRGIGEGSEVLLLTWLHRADRSTLLTHPRNEPSNPLTGVFFTRSPDRPNPIGLHRVDVLAVEGTRMRVSALEAVDGTPVVDVKCLLGPDP